MKIDYMAWIVSSSVLIAVLLLVRLLLRQRIGPRLRYALWAVVLVRLLVPFSFGSAPISVMHPAERLPAVQTAETVADLETIIREADGSVWGYPGGSMEDVPVQVTPYSTAAEVQQMQTALDLRDTLLTVWKTGTVLALAVLLAVNLRFFLTLRRSRRPLDTDLVPLRVYVSGAVDTPCLFGVVRPAVYVTPETAADHTLLRHTLAHEYTHFSQGDHVWAVLRGLCLAVHWFNPLVWAAAVLSRQDAELSCDEGTIRRLGEDQRAAYGRTLLHMTCEKRTALLTAATTMTGSGRSIRQRITSLVSRPRTAAAVLAAVLLVTAAAAGCTFTDSGEKDPDKDMTLYPCGDFTAALPAAYADALIVETADGSEDGTLLTVWERTSLEEARADGGEMPEQWGWICTIAVSDQREFEQSLAGELAGASYFAEKDGSWFVLYEPTDVRLYRSGMADTDSYGEEALAQWDRAHEAVRGLTVDFTRRNDLRPFDAAALYQQGYYGGESLWYLYQPQDDPNGASYLRLSQPARQEPDGIWCVERFLSVYGFGGAFWFPESSDDAITCFAQIQAQHDAGERSDYADPMAAIMTFFRESPFFGGHVPREQELTRLPDVPTVEEKLRTLDGQSVSCIRDGRLSADLTEAYAKPLTEALRRSTDHPGRKSALLNGFQPDGRPYWQLLLWTKSSWPVQDKGPALTLGCGRTRDLVQVCFDQGPIHQESVFRDKTLYQLVRSALDPEQDVDKAVYRTFRDLLDTDRDRTMSAAGADWFSKIACDRLTPIWQDTDTQGGTLQLYAVSYLLTPVDPDDLDRAGIPIAFTGDLRVPAESVSGPLAVRCPADGQPQAAFMGPGYLPGQDDGQTRQDLLTVLDRTAVPDGLPLHAVLLETMPERWEYRFAGQDTFLENQTDPDRVRAAFWVDSTAENLRYFIPQADGQGRIAVPETPLYTLETLPPSRLFTAELVPDGLDRAIALELDGQTRLFLIRFGGPDGLTVTEAER